MQMMCVLIPHFPLKCEKLKNPGLAKAAVIAREAGSKKRLMDYSPQLRGLEAGMALERALGLYGDVEVLNADLAGYQSVFNTMLDHMQLKSPLLEGPEPGVIYTSMKGMELIYPDETGFIKALMEGIPLVFEPRFGIAAGKFPAMLAAAAATPGGCKSLASNNCDFIRNTPCSRLPVSAGAKASLAGFGLKTLGQIAALPRPALEAQFGPEGKRIWELSNGQDSEPLHPRPARRIIEERQELATVTVSLDVLLLSFEDMLKRAFAELTPRGMGILCAEIWTRTTSCQYYRKAVHFKQPAPDTRTCLRRIKHVLESCPQPGPVEEAGVVITGSTCLAGRQNSLLPDIRSRDNFLNEMRQMEFKMGSPKVFKFREVEPWSRIPERRHVLAPLNG